MHGEACSKHPHSHAWVQAYMLCQNQICLEFQGPASKTTNQTFGVHEPLESHMISLQGARMTMQILPEVFDSPHYSQAFSFCSRIVLFSRGQTPTGKADRQLVEQASTAAVEQLTRVTCSNWEYCCLSEHLLRSLHSRRVQGRGPAKDRLSPSPQHQKLSTLARGFPCLK